MKAEARHLREKALSSLLLAIELFNRPHERGRADAVLILLDHAFEMLLKAAIVHRDGSIREPGAKQTIGFDHCVRKGLSDGDVQFLTQEQALTLQTINGYRDAAQRHLLELSEQMLYTYTRAGVSLFGDLLQTVFDMKLSTKLPARVLPISSEPPKDLPLMIDDEVATIRALIESGKRKQLAAKARLRGLVIADSAAQGEFSQPTEHELDTTVKALKKSGAWQALFPGLAAMTTTVEPGAIPYAIRITKKEGIPIRLVPEGTEGARVVAVKRVDELGFYNLGHNDLSKKLKMTPPKLVAVLRALKLDENEKYSKEIALGKVRQRRYSQEAVAFLSQEIPKLDLADIWAKFGPKRFSKIRGS